ncbi:phosphatase PAP2 family protein [Amycolatopsis anabasis]|uniref:phosphatase PAP2 family protein n=1 Tax=Amycolatopsis anabasis TaxID=1840409 RepID=UPI00131DBDF9|nr:phosphatase PAP2 family protein [Amycolatopsis anabasis]
MPLCADSATPIRTTAPPRHRRRAAPSLRGPALGLAGCLAAFLAGYFGFVLTATGQRWDRELFAALTTNTSPALQEGSDRLLELIGQIAILLGSVAVILLIGIARKRLAVGLAAAAIIPCAIGASRLLKLFVLTRPELGPDTSLTHNSFPSGHATAATSTGLALLLVAPRRARPGLSLLGGAWALVAGFAVVIAGWHRPSDALGAAALSGAVYCAAVLICRRRRLLVAPVRTVEPLRRPARHRVHS